MARLKPISWVYEGDCKILTSHALNRGGYGTLKVDGKTVRLHRLVWASSNGPIPEGMCVRHKCDNPACFTLSHLEIGTHQDNMRDMAKRGRSVKNRPDSYAKGEGNSQSKLTTREAAYIKFFSGKRTTIDMSSEFDVSKNTIVTIKNGKAWIHLKKEDFPINPLQ